MSHDHHHQTFIQKYIFSVDHKVIGIQYLITGLIMAILGGLLAYVFRYQLAYPNESVPGFGLVGADVYNSFVTMHGTVMVFWVAMPILISGFGNYLGPIMVGADDMAFPRLNMMSYWVFFVSTVVLIVSFFVPGGSFSGGWTSYPPLSANPGYSGVVWGGHLWILAVALEFASMLMSGVNLITTTIAMRAKGLTFYRMPMVVWMLNIASVVFMFSVGPLIAGAFMLLMDRMFGMGFYSPTSGGDPLLFQHLFWFFGHPEVYVILLPAFGIIFEVMTTFSRKPVFAYKPVIYATLVASVLSFVVWAHHQFISGIDPRLAAPFGLTTILISVPFAFILFSMIAILKEGRIEFSSAMLFALGFMFSFLIGGVTGIFNGASAADIYLHDTYFVVAHFHYTLFPSVFLAGVSGIYYWYPKMFGRMMNETLGKIHFWGTFLAFNGVFIPLFFIGLAGHHRRIYNPLNFELLKPVQYLHVISTISLIILLLSQLPFIFNFFMSFKNGKKAERNPWNANSLEWQAPSPPGHGNFDKPIEVFRGPYDYSVPGASKDWLAQTEA